jgi:hypothetical protein
MTRKNTLALLWREACWFSLALALLVVALVWLGGCTPQPLVGPPADLETVARPDPVVAPTPPPTPAVAQPAPQPSAPLGWRAWIPPTQSPNGDREEGHWVTISPQGVTLEEIEPDKPMPRAPRTYTPNRPVRSERRGSPSAVSSPGRPPQAFTPGPQGPGTATPLSPAPVGQPPQPLGAPSHPLAPFQTPATQTATPTPAIPASGYSEAVQQLQRMLAVPNGTPPTSSAPGGPTK